MCARRVLAEPMVVCVRRQSNMLRCSVRGQSQIVLLPSVCLLDVYWLSLRLCAFDGNPSGWLMKVLARFEWKSILLFGIG